jgi:hypothetical protein
VRSDSDSVFLLRPDGKEVKVPKSRLSKQSLDMALQEAAYYEELHAAKTKSSKPKPGPLADLPRKPESIAPVPLDEQKDDLLPRRKKPTKPVDELPPGFERFRYSFGGNSVEGKSEKLDELVFVYHDLSAKVIACTMNELDFSVSTSMLGITNNRLHLGSGKENFLMSLNFFLAPDAKDATGQLSTESKFSGSEDKYAVRGMVVVSHLRPGPTYESRWFGKPASLVPLEDQEILMKKGGIPLIGFGTPFKIESESEVERAVYGEFSPIAQVATIQEFIDDPDLKFIVGERVMSIDDDARRTFILFARSVEVLRHKKGIRDSNTRRSLEDR